MSAYPTQNLFFSNEWRERLAQQGLDTPAHVNRKAMGVSIAFRNHDYLADFEEWPGADYLQSDEGRRLCQSRATIAMFRKLLPEGRPAGLPSGSFVWASNISPYLDLKSPLSFNNHTMSAIRRSEKHFTKMFGPLTLSCAPANQRKRWFKEWLEFKTKRYVMDDGVRQVIERWLTEGEHPDWIRLFELNAGKTPLCRGLSYVWNGVFYFAAPTYNSEPQIAKLSPGKLLVQKLVEYAQQEQMDVFDFLPGDEPYKFHWNPTVRTLYQCEVPLTLAGRAVLAARRLKLAVKRR